MIGLAFAFGTIGILIPLAGQFADCIVYLIERF